jgi:hypothetical protein
MLIAAIILAIGGIAATTLVMSRMNAIDDL